MINRRSFIKSIVSFTTIMGITVPAVAKATQPEPESTFPFHDVGPRGGLPRALEDAPFSESAHTPANLSHWELKGIKETMKEYTGATKIRWGIPGNKDNTQGVLLFNSIVVTFKSSNLRTSTLYIEVQRVT